MKSIDYGPYAVKNVRTFRGMEGMGGFNASLYRDGKKVGVVLNDDSGAPNMYQIPDDELMALIAHAKSVLGKDKFEVEDTFIGQMIDDFETTKRFKRYCKKSTLFRLKGDTKGEWRSVTCPFDFGVKQHLTLKYGDKIETILDKNAEPVEL